MGRLEGLAFRVSRQRESQREAAVQHRAAADQQRAAAAAMQLAADRSSDAASAHAECASRADEVHSYILDWIREIRNAGR